MQSNETSANRLASQVKKETGDWYSYTTIDRLDCQYNIIIGERSNGKTYGALKKILDNYWKKKEKGAYIRRYKEDYRGKRGDALFESLEKDCTDSTAHLAVSTVHFAVVITVVTDFSVIEPAVSARRSAVSAAAA